MVNPGIDKQIRSSKKASAIISDLGIKESDVRNHLHAVRKQLQQELRAELRETTLGERELEEEWRALFA